MFGVELSTAQLIAVAIIPTLFAIVVHEVAHGWVAFRLGDSTAYMMGRLTLNPFKHIDLIGTILVPLVLILTVGFAFGWAKPVPVNLNNLRHPRRDTALVAAAGPGANLLMAIGWTLIIKLTTMLPADANMLALPLFYMGLFGIVINLILMVFNLIPIPPTDGGRILTTLLPAKLAYQISRVEPYGMIILLLLLVSGVLWRLFDVVHRVAISIVQSLL